jgi:hypothetical protein
MRMLRVFSFMILLLGSGTLSIAQSKSLFAGEEKLSECLVELPLTYAAKDKERYTQAARLLEETELVYLKHDKKTGTTSYSRVFVVVEQSKDGTDLVYVESSDDHLRMGGSRQAMFPKFRPATERFYNAACFDQKIIEFPELKDRVIVQ